jgi:hypothetical protein
VVARPAPAAIAPQGPGVDTRLWLGVMAQAAPQNWIPFATRADRALRDQIGGAAGTLRIRCRVVPPPDGREMEALMGASIGPTIYDSGALARHPHRRGAIARKSATPPSGRHEAPLYGPLLTRRPQPAHAARQACPRGGASHSWRAPWPCSSRWWSGVSFRCAPISAMIPSATPSLHHRCPADIGPIGGIHAGAVRAS